MSMWADMFQARPRHLRGCGRNLGEGSKGRGFVSYEIPTDYGGWGPGLRMTRVD